MDFWPSLAEMKDALAEAQGAGVRIAILDTGVAEEHPDLRSATFMPAHAAQVSGDRITVARCAPTDVFGHGTAVAGIIHELAPEAELQSIRVLDQTKRQHRHEVIKAGALFAIRNGAHILHCSFGRPASSFTFPIYKAWTDAAFLSDCHVVAASSNDSPDTPHWPSAFPQTIAVTSSEMETEPLLYRAGALVSFAAPGTDVPVLSADGGHTVLTGSSFAAARVTGWLARLLSRFPAMSPSFGHEALRRVAMDGAMPIR